MTDTKTAASGTSEDKPAKVGRRMSEEDVASKRDNRGRPVSFEKGSLTYVTAKVAAKHPELADKIGKQVVRKKCEESGKLFWVATSDLHQCFYAPEVRRKMRNLKAAQGRAERKVALEELEELRANATASKAASS